MTQPVFKALIIFFFGAVLSWMLAGTINVQSKKNLDKRFIRNVELINLSIQKELETYIALLRATAGFFVGLADVDPEDFENYASRINFPVNYPGLQGIGFSVKINSENLSAIEAMMRKYGIDDFKVWPDFSGEQHAIIYLQPLDIRNREAIGYNMFSDEVRREAMIRARDTGLPAASGKVFLVQEIFEDKQSGFLIYLPYYGKAPDLVSPSERRDKLLGFIYAPIRVGDFIESIVGPYKGWIDLRVYDKDSSDSFNQIFTSPFYSVNGLEAVRTLNIAGRMWEIRYRPGPDFTAGLEAWSYYSIIVVGIILSLILAILFYRSDRAIRDKIQSESRLRRIIDNLNAFAAEVSLDGTMIEVNKSILLISGTTRDEIIGIRLWECPWWGGNAEVIERVKKAFLGALDGQYIRYDEIAVTKTGENIIIDCMLSPVIDDRGIIRCIIPSAIDITARRHAEDALKESEEKFRDTFEYAAVGIAHVAADGRWLEVNSRLCKILGYTEEEFYDMSFLDITHPDDVHEDFSLMKKMEEKKLPYIRREKRFYHKNGQIVWVNVTVSWNKDVNNAVNYYIAVIEDITMRKHLEIRLNKEIERKNQFLATLSHELRNPLAPIRNAFSLLKMDNISQPLKEELIETGLKSTEHLVRLVNDLLDITRITRGKIELHKENINLVAVLKEAIEEVRPVMTERNQTFESYWEDQNIIIYGDPSRIRQIFSNILMNAAKYTQKGGNIQAKCYINKKNAVVEILDNGPGIPEEMIGDIFGIFVQAEDPLKRGEGGLGIGLAIVRELMILHGGQVKAANRDEGGMKFSLIFPMVPELK